jgi:hypothetical protein
MKVLRNVSMSYAIFLLVRSAACPSRTKADTPTWEVRISVLSTRVLIGPQTFPQFINHRNLAFWREIGKRFDEEALSLERWRRLCK